MTPIESTSDLRLCILHKTLIDIVESLATQTGTNPEHILSDYLFLSCKSILEHGTNSVVKRIVNDYSMLNEVLK